MAQQMKQAENTRFKSGLAAKYKFNTPNEIKAIKAKQSES